MLIGQYGRGDKEGNLLAIGSSLEGSTDRDLGLPEAYVTAEQAIHRIGSLHIGLHSRRCHSLVGCIFEGKRGL